MFLTKHFIVLIISFLPLFSLAQINIEGKVSHQNKPLEYVSVFLDNTTIGTTTDENGLFRLSMKEGTYQLVISYLGYKTITYTLNTQKYNKPLEFSLEKQDFSLQEVVVSRSKYDENWKYNLARFQREFIGFSKDANQCKILNPKTLFFDFDAKSSKLTAYAKEPLHIRNKALGYDIYYTLEHFTIQKNQVYYLGYAQFKDLKGGKNKRKKWQNNRRKAYYGSRIHFLKSVYQQNTTEQGFLLHLFKREKNKERPSQEEITKARKVLSQSKYPINFTKKIDVPKNHLDSALLTVRKAQLPEYVDYLYQSNLTASDISKVENDSTFLAFKDNLMVVYTLEKEEQNYIHRKIGSVARKPAPQTSNIIPINQPNLINPIGVLENPLDVFFEGYWSYEKFALALPLNYEP